MMAMLRHGSLILAASGCLWLASVACSNDTDVLFRSTGGSGGNPTTTSNGTTSNGTGGTTACIDGGACTLEGSTCADSACCPCIYECRGGAWTIQACAGCPEPACPFDPPLDGAPCGECSSPSFCSYERCDLGGIMDATCLVSPGGTGQWRVESIMCEPPPPCGDDPMAPPCLETELCVIAEVTVGPTTQVSYACQPNPCIPFPTSCDCAVFLCQQTNAQLCVDASPRHVLCTNGGQ